MKNVEMTNAEFVDLFNGLISVQGLKGVKFGLLVAKNVRAIQSELEYLENASKPSDAFVELSAKINECANKKDDEGIKALESEHADLIQERKDQLEELNKLMQDKAAMSLSFIPEDCLPADITGEQIMAIDKIIE